MILPLAKCHWCRASRSHRRQAELLGISRRTGAARSQYGMLSGTVDARPVTEPGGFAKHPAPAARHARNALLQQTQQSSVNRSARFVGLTERHGLGVTIAHGHVLVRLPIDCVAHTVAPVPGSDGAETTGCPSARPRIGRTVTRLANLPMTAMTMVIRTNQKPIPVSGQQRVR